MYRICPHWTACCPLSLTLHRQGGFSTTNPGFWCKKKPKYMMKKVSNTRGDTRSWILRPFSGGGTATPTNASNNNCRTGLSLLSWNTFRKDHCQADGWTSPTHRTARQRTSGMPIRGQTAAQTNSGVRVTPVLPAADSAAKCGKCAPPAFDWPGKCRTKKKKKAPTRLRIKLDKQGPTKLRCWQGEVAVKRRR